MGARLSRTKSTRNYTRPNTSAPVISSSQSKSMPLITQPPRVFSVPNIEGTMIHAKRVENHVHFQEATTMFAEGEDPYLRQRRELYEQMSKRPVVEVQSSTNPSIKIRRIQLSEEEIEKYNQKDEEFVKAVSKFAYSVQSVPLGPHPTSQAEQLKILDQLRASKAKSAAEEVAQQTQDEVKFGSKLGESGTFVGNRSKLPRARTSTPDSPIDIDTNALQQGKLSTNHIKILFKKFSQKEDVDFTRMPPHEYFFLTPEAAAKLFKYYGPPKSIKFSEWADQRGISS